MIARFVRNVPIVLLVLSVTSCTSAERDVTGLDPILGAIEVGVTSSGSSGFQITVYLNGPAGFPTRTATMNLGGTVTFGGLDPGTYTVGTTIFGFECQPVSATIQGNHTAEADIACIQRAAPTTGIVTGIVLGGGSPLSGASVELSASGVSLSRLTGPNGQLSFVGVPGGEYQLKAVHMLFGCPVQTIHIVPDRTTTVDIVCSPKSTGTITGIVTPSDVDGAVVQLTGPAARTTTADHRDDSFAFHELPPGAYTATVTVPGWECDPVRADVQAARNTTVQIPCEFRSTPSGPAGPLPGEIAGAWGYHRALRGQTGICPGPLPEPGTGSIAFGFGNGTMTTVGLDPQLAFVGIYDQESGSYAASGAATLGDGTTLQSSANLGFYWDVWDFGGLVFVGSLTRNQRDPSGTQVCTEVYDVWGWRI